MKRSFKILMAILVLIVVAFVAFLGWRVYKVNQQETLTGIIQEAWERTQSDDMPEYMQYMEMYSSFGVKKIEKGDPWVVTVHVWGVDLAEQMRNIDPARFSAGTEERDLDEYLVSLVKKADVTSVECIVYMYPREDGFRVQFTETFVDAMSGMVLTYAREMAQEAVRGAR